MAVEITQPITQCKVVSCDAGTPGENLDITNHQNGEVIHSASGAAGVKERSPDNTSSHEKELQAKVDTAWEVVRRYWLQSSASANDSYEGTVLDGGHRWPAHIVGISSSLLRPNTFRQWCSVANPAAIDIFAGVLVHLFVCSQIPGLALEEAFLQLLKELKELRGWVVSLCKLFMRLYHRKAIGHNCFLHFARIRKLVLRRRRIRLCR